MFSYFVIGKSLLFHVFVTVFPDQFSGVLSKILKRKLLNGKIQELKSNLLRNCGVSKRGGSHHWKDGNSHYHGIFFCFKNFYCAGKLDQRENGWMEQIMDVVCSMG